MGLLSGKNSNEKQIEHYAELLENTRERYEALEEVQGSPEVEAQRNQLFEEMKQIEITIEETRGRDEPAEGLDNTLDLFDD